MFTSILSFLHLSNISEANPSEVWYPPWNFSRIRVENGTILNEQNETVYLRGAAVDGMCCLRALHSMWGGAEGMMQKLNNSGVHFIRLPISYEYWNNSITLKQMDEIIAAADKYKIYVAVDWHTPWRYIDSTEGLLNNVGNNRTNFYANWTMMASRYVNNVSFAIAEVMNEPYIGTSNKTDVMLKWREVMNELAWYIRNGGFGYSGNPNVIIAISSIPDYQFPGMAGDRDWWLDNPVNFSNRMYTFNKYWKDIYGAARTDILNNQWQKAYYDWISEDKGAFTQGTFNFFANYSGKEALLYSEYGFATVNPGDLSIISSQWYAWLTHYNISYYQWWFMPQTGSYGLFSNLSDPVGSLWPWGKVWHSYLPAPRITKQYKIQVFNSRHHEPYYNKSSILQDAIVYFNNGSDYSQQVDRGGWVNFTAPASYNVSIRVEWHGKVIKNTFYDSEPYDKIYDITADFDSEDNISSSVHDVMTDKIIYSSSWDETNKSLKVAIINNEDDQNFTNLFFDDFTQCNLNNWTVISGGWRCDNNQLLFWGQKDKGLIKANMESYSDYVFNATIISGDAASRKSFVFRLQNDTNYYRVNFGSQNDDIIGWASLVKVINGTETELASVSPVSDLAKQRWKLPLNASIRVTTVKNSMRVQVWLNDSYLLDYLETPATFTNGTIGFYEGAWRVARFDNIVVREAVDDSIGNLYVYWPTVNSSLKIKFNNGTVLNAGDYWNETTKIITIPFNF